ncbi:hypothetical protein CLF_101056 [Clonorchis sinensis]|uniref:Reverse transcriptase domain-containing protein n=1 Tax=Clonorchis sinensis TaxID=79923 RepID=G7Y4V7_CLOSI|nr:hypothetical protein CLF_101056 [Clonorchis sinensis]
MLRHLGLITPFVLHRFCKQASALIRCRHPQVSPSQSSSLDAQCAVYRKQEFTVPAQCSDTIKGNFSDALNALWRRAKSSDILVVAGDLNTFKPRRPIYLVAFNVRTLKQACQQVALALSLDSFGIDVCCVSETRIQATHNWRSSGCCGDMCRGWLFDWIPVDNRLCTIGLTSSEGERESLPWSLVDTDSQENRGCPKILGCQKMVSVYPATGSRRPPVRETIKDRNGVEKKNAWSGGTNTLNTGYRCQQGCSVSPFLFNLVIDEIMRRTLEGLQNPGVQIACDEKLVDLEYAYDTILTFEEENTQVFLEELTKFTPSFDTIVCEMVVTRSCAQRQDKPVCLVRRLIIIASAEDMQTSGDRPICYISLLRVNIRIGYSNKMMSSVEIDSPLISINVTLTKLPDKSFTNTANLSDWIQRCEIWDVSRIGRKRTPNPQENQKPIDSGILTYTKCFRTRFNRRFQNRMLFGYRNPTKWSAYLP